MSCGADCHAIWGFGATPRHQYLPYREFRPTPHHVTGHRYNLHELVQRCSWCNRLHLKMGAFHQSLLDPESIVICIQGLCSNPGTPEAKSSYGVFWGPDNSNSSSRNHGKCVPKNPDLHETELTASLHAAISALTQVKEHTRTWGYGSGCCKVLILTNSNLLVDGISNCYWEGPTKLPGLTDAWMVANGVRCGRFTVLEQMMFSRLNYLVVELEQRFGVWFWALDEDIYKEAKAHATNAFEMYPLYPGRPRDIWREEAATCGHGTQH